MEKSYLLLFIFIITACLGGAPGGGGSSTPSSPVSESSDDSDYDLEIENYSITVTPLSSKIYKHGETISLTLTTPNALTISGTPRIKLNIGNSTSEYANYASGSGTTTLVFSYNVNITSKDLIDTDGISWENSIDLNGGTIRFDNGEKIGKPEFNITSATGVKVHVGTFLAWYDASDASTISDAGEAYANDAGFSNIVDVWESKAGSTSMNLSTKAGTVAYDSTGLNGKPSIDLPGNAYLEAGTSIFSSNSDFTIIAVTFSDDNTGDRHLISESNTGDVFFYNSGGDFSVSQFGRSLASVGGISGESDPFILTAVTDASETNIYINESSSLNSSATALTGDASLNKLRLGRQYAAGEYWDGDVSEILIFDEALADDQKDALISYLKDKWDI